ncbi:pyruvate dehydrogenase E1 component subunit alpha, mitochondrial-like [Osmia bicornis bicornis]|uniref:pyruvate dehydrogenase E1 component subunit alpha, mitochondrial-like n=1 Tax=Osmia bicornis bicornis TaxID=1437191 RepID=UPI001EAEE267|nr:pyruvate dehydrogenase E1 component subunit alpha, mitochondrial-like [Osmia bicornis bicornis]
MVTYRYFGHSMSDPGTSYRTRDEVKSVRDERDPIKLFIQVLVENGLKTSAEIQVSSRRDTTARSRGLIESRLYILVKQIQDSVNKVVDEELEQAKADPPPEMSEIAANVYVKPLEKIRGKVPWEVH